MIMKTNKRMADWWCVFNAREWPSDLGVQRPFEEHQAQMFGLRLIESLLSRRFPCQWKKLI